MKKGTYTLYWLDGKSEIARGFGIVDAVKNAGYDNGALKALDFYDNGDTRDEYAWDNGAKSWIRISTTT